MVLFSFSEPKHIPLIPSGAKAQTTRIPRKPRANGKKWAVLDGFKNWDVACDWFEKSTHDPEWMYRELDVIKWNGQHIAGRVA